MNLIAVLDLDTGYHKTLINTDLDEPRAIVVDPREDQRFVYFTDWGQEARIERMGLNGEDRTVLLSGSQVAWPNGLTIGEFCSCLKFHSCGHYVSNCWNIIFLNFVVYAM